MHDSFLTACRQSIGEANVLTTAAEIERFEQDFWNQYRGSAAAVLRPGSAAEVSAVVALAARHGVPLVPQAGNTGLVDGGIPDRGGRSVVVSVERLDRIRHLDPAGDFLIVEAGCVLDAVREAAEGAGRLFPLALGSGGSCRIGGNIGTNAGGLNVLRYGMVRDLVLGLEVVLPDGSLLDTLKPLRKDNTGYDLKQLFIGSEGTLGVITAAALRLVARPRERVTVWLSMETPEQAISLFKRFRDGFGELISAFELICSEGVEIAVAHLPGARRPVSQPWPWHVLVELAWTFEDGLRPRVEAALEAVVEAGLCADGAVAESETQRAAIWRLREGQSEAARRFGYILRSDVTVPVSRLPDLLDWTAGETRRLGPAGIRVLPFGHVGDGNLHVNYVIPDGVEVDRNGLLEALYEQVDFLGGSISAEHGVGRAKRAAVDARKPAAARSLSRRIKQAIDPQGIMNPGVVVAPDGQP